MNAHTSARLTIIEQACDPVVLALRSLAENDEAVALAKIVRIAEPFTATRPALGLPENFAMYDCHALCGDRLDDLIFDAARDFDLERSELPVRDGVVDILQGASHE